MKKTAGKLKNIYLMSFLIPILLMLGIFILRGIYPFGARSFLFSDMYHQYLPFLTEFWNKLHGGEALSFSWHVGLGSDFTAVYAYYLASPFNWLAYFCPKGLLIEFMTYLIVLKIGFCGVSFAYYLSRKFETRDVRIVWFSVLYAMSGFVAAYSFNQMWMDCLYLAPLIVLGLEELVLKKKCRLYCLSLTACIFSNYYLSIILCIFLVLYFLLQLFTNGLSLKKKAIAAWHFAVTSLLAGGMAGALLVPAFFAMRHTGFHAISFPKKIELYFQPLPMLARHVPMLQTERGLDHWPNLYCGALVFLLVPIYFLHKKIPFKQKIGKAVLLAVFLASFSLNILNFIWHGLNYPDSLPARQSFLYILVVLTMCFEAVHRDEENGRKNKVAGVVCGLLFLGACGIFVTTDGFTVAVVACAWIFLAGYIILGLLPRGVKRYGILALVCVEAFLNMEATGVGTVSRTSYLEKEAVYEELAQAAEADGGEFVRMDSREQMTKNDALLGRYYSASVFSSTVNDKVRTYYRKLGLTGSKVSYGYKGATPFTEALLGVQYVISELPLREELYEQVAVVSDKYLYKVRKTLSAGFFITEELKTAFEEILAERASNSLVLQTKLAQKISPDGFLFRGMKVGEQKSKGNEITICPTQDGQLYGIVAGKPEGKVILKKGNETRELHKANKDALVDLGFFAAGETFTVTAEEEENLTMQVYRMDEGVLQRALAVLGETTFTVEDVSASGLSGSIVTDKEGYLILTVPTEPGWKITVDGKKTEGEALADAMLALRLSAGSHRVELSYKARGVALGISISLVSLALYVLLYERKRKEQ